MSHNLPPHAIHKPSTATGADLQVQYDRHNWPHPDGNRAKRRDHAPLDNSTQNLTRGARGGSARTDRARGVGVTRKAQGRTSRAAHVAHTSRCGREGRTPTNPRHEPLPLREEAP